MTATTTTEPTDAQLVARLTRAGAKGKTAGELGTTAARLKSIEGVTVIGTRPTGRRGRPPLVFGVAEVNS